MWMVAERPKRIAKQIANVQLESTPNAIQNNRQVETIVRRIRENISVVDIDQTSIKILTKLTTPY
jgi:chorismate mutase